jgi:hypothetical protein
VEAGALADVERRLLVDRVLGDARRVADHYGRERQVARHQQPRPERLVDVQLGPDVLGFDLFEEEQPTGRSSVIRLHGSRPKSCQTIRAWPDDA